MAAAARALVLSASPLPNLLLRPLKPHLPKNVDLTRRTTLRSALANAPLHTRHWNALPGPIGRSDPISRNDLLFEKQVGAFCWVHAINVSLGYIMIEFARSLDINREFWNERANDDVNFHLNGHYNYNVAKRFQDVFDTFETKMLGELHLNANDRLKLVITDNDCVVPSLVKYGR
jgi:hypothetical protein